MSENHSTEPKPWSGAAAQDPYENVSGSSPEDLRNELIEIGYGACPDEMSEGAARRVGINVADALLRAGWTKTSR